MVSENGGRGGRVPRLLLPLRLQRKRVVNLLSNMNILLSTWCHKPDLSPELITLPYNNDLQMGQICH